MSADISLSANQKQVCDLVHPERSVPVDRVEELPRGFIHENKLGAAVQTELPDFEDDTPESVTERAVYEELGSITQYFQTNDVKYAVIKSILPIPKQIGDLDILVDEIDDAEPVLKKHGYTAESQQPYKRKYHRETEHGRVTVHLHDEIAWHGQIYLDKNHVLANTSSRSYPGGDVPVPSPVHEALIIAAHMLFEKGNNRIILLDVLSFWVWNLNGDLDIGEMQTLASENGWEFGLNCYLAGTADVYRQAYGEQFSSAGAFESLADLTVPFNQTYDTFVFTFPQMYSIRKQRLRWIGQNEKFREQIYCLQTYVRDFINEFTNRYGFTYTMRRIRQ